MNKRVYVITAQWNNGDVSLVEAFAEEDRELAYNKAIELNAETTLDCKYNVGCTTLFENMRKNENQSSVLS